MTEDAISYGVTGPTGRASGFSCDVRTHQPYGLYKDIDVKEILYTEGDTYSRYKARIDEMWESVRIIETLIDNIPDGDFQAKTRNVIKLPKGEYYQNVETARGELGVFVVSTGGMSPYRLKFRSPGFSNVSALDKMARGGKIADLIAIMSTIDLVVPDIDR